MNSALQCLSNTEQLTKFFLSDQYRSDINRTNKLGMQGEVAEAYGNLVKAIWSSSGSSVIPREFKVCILMLESWFLDHYFHFPR